MLILGALIISVICTFLIVYFTEYAKTGSILGWSIPLYLLAFFLGAILLFIICVSIYTLFIDKTKKILKPSKALSRITWLACQFVVTLFGLKIIVEGKEKLPKDGKFLFVSNHQSILDPIITIYLFPQFIFTFIMKKQVLKIPVVGNWLYGAGFLPLDRDNNRSGLETIVMATKRCALGYPVCVYPEGTRSKNTEIREFRNGIFKVAQRSQSPIVVCTLDNAFRIKKRFPFRRTKVILKISEVIPFEKIDNIHTNEIGEIVGNIMKQDLKNFRENNNWIGK